MVTPMYRLPCNFAKSGLAIHNYSVRCQEESLCIIIDDEGVQDLYWNDDTHWSWRAQQCIGDALWLVMGGN